MTKKKLIIFTIILLLFLTGCAVFGTKQKHHYLKIDVECPNGKTITAPIPEILLT